MGSGQQGDRKTEINIELTCLLRKISFVYKIFIENAASCVFGAKKPGTGYCLGVPPPGPGAQGGSFWTLFLCFYNNYYKK